MRKYLFILLLFVATIGCSSPQKMTEKIVPINSAFFKADAVYSKFIDDNFLNLYYFNSEDKTVYISKIKNNDVIFKTKDFKINTSAYGEYKIEANSIKIQKYIYKAVNVHEQSLLKRALYVLLPIPNSSKVEVTIVDKELITEGEIKKDSLIMNKTYFGTKKFDFKMESSSKISNIKSILIYNPKFKGISTKESKYSSYSIVIIPAE